MSGYVTTGNYEVVDYVENLGGNYFDTGFIPNQDTRVRCKFKILSLTNGQCRLFGAGNASNDHAFEIVTWDGNLEFNYNNAYQFSQETLQIGDIVEIDFNKNIVKYKINNGEEQTITFSYRSFNAPWSMYVFFIHRPTPTTITSYSQLYYFEVYDNGELIRNYKPVMNIHTGEVGVYETLNEEPVTLLGTGTLVPGEPTGEYVDTKTSTRLKVNASRDITQLDYDLAECEDGWFSRYTRVNYLSDYKDSIVNTSYIQTDVIHNQIGYYDITFQYNEASFNCVIGTNNSAGNKYICWYNNSLHEGNSGNVIDTGNDRIIGHQYRFICKKGTNQSVAYRDGEFLKNFTSNMWDPTTNKLHLLGMPGYPGGKNFIYQCEFRTSEDGEVLGKFIPCIRNSDSHAGMYDMVTKQFYEPLSGSFYPGPIESHFDYQKFHMYCARPIYQIDIDIADKIDGWFGDYIRCDYIESTGQQYIDTGYSAPHGFRSQLGVIMTQLPGGSQRKMAFIGSHNPQPPYGRNDLIFTEVPVGGVPNSLELGASVVGRTDYVISLNTRYDIDFGVVAYKSYLKDANVTLSGTDDGVRSNNTLYLFQVNDWEFTPFIGKTYYVKIWNENDELVRDYIPCIRRSDMKAGLYDLVGCQFYTSSNGYDFIPGGRQYEFNFIKY